MKSCSTCKYGRNNSEVGYCCILNKRGFFTEEEYDNYKCKDFKRDEERVKAIHNIVFRVSGLILAGLLIFFSL